MPETLAIQGPTCLPPATLRVRKAGDSIVAQGPSTHTVRRDPIVDPSGPATHSLEAGWSFENDRVTIFADRLGLIPLYYRAGDEEIVVSDAITALADEIPGLEIDFFELYTFLRLGIYPGAGTPFQGVHRLRRAETVVWDNGRITRSCPPDDMTPFAGTREDAITEAHRLFESAVRKRVHNDLRQIVPLTGGRDSRHIFAELTRQKAQRLEAVTVRYMRDYAEDVRVAGLLANVASVPHRVLTNDYRPYFRQLADQIVINQFESPLHQWMQAITGEMSGAEYLFFDGLGGDGLLNSAYVGILPAHMGESVLSGDVERIADAYIEHYEPPPYLRRLPGSDSFDARLKSRVMEEMKRYEGAPDLMCRFAFDNRTRRATGIGALGTFGRFAQVSLPYLDQDLVDFGFRLPASGYWRPGFHDEVIARHYPEFAHIPFENITLRKGAKLDWHLQVRMLSGSVPLLLRLPRATILSRSYVIPRLLVGGLKLELFDYLYIAEYETYFQTLRRYAKVPST